MRVRDDAETGAHSPRERLGVGAQVEGVEAEVGRQAAATVTTTSLRAQSTDAGCMAMRVFYSIMAAAALWCGGSAARRDHSLGLLQVRRRLGARQPAACCRPRHGADLQGMCAALTCLD